MRKQARTIEQAHLADWMKLGWQQDGEPFRSPRDGRILITVIHTEAKGRKVNG